MTFTLTPLPEDHHWACVLCHAHRTPGDRRADWESRYTGNGGGIERVCDAHLPEYAQNMILFRDLMANV
jgi:hypothetical protein